jgi:hypothetical protein
MRLKLNFPWSVDDELPVGNQLLNPAMVTRDNAPTGIFRVFLGVTSGPGYYSFLRFRIFVLAVTVVGRDSSTQTHTKETLWIIAIRFRVVQQVVGIDASYNESFLVRIPILDLKDAITSRRPEIKVELVIPSIYLEAQVGKHLSQFDIYGLGRAPRSLKPALITPWLFCDDLEVRMHVRVK